MLEDLLNVIHSEWFEEGECFFEIAEASLAGDVLAFSLRIDLLGDGDQFWKVECIGYLEHRVTLGIHYQVESYGDHVLLWPYIYPSASLSFFGESENPLAVVGALYTQHVKTVHRWIPFHRFLNGNPHEMIAGRYGMLAEGPVPLLEAYASVLNEFGIGNEIANPKPAPYTNDSMVRMEEVSALIFDTDSHVIGAKFNAERLE